MKAKDKFAVTFPAYSAHAETHTFTSRAAALAHVRALGATRQDFLAACTVLVRDERRYSTGRTLPGKGGIIKLTYVPGHVGGWQWHADVVRTSATKQAKAYRRYADY